MKNKPSKARHFLNDTLNLTGDGLHCKMALAILPQLREVLSKSTYDRIQGRLRRNDLSCLEAPELSNLLERARDGSFSCSHDLYYKIYQFKSLFAKLPPLGSSELQDRNAIKVFLEGEKRCSITNRFLKKKHFSVDHIHWEIKDLISEILGPLPADFLDQEVSFGPGSTVNPGGRKYSETSEFFKLSDKLYVTSSSKYFLAAHLSYNKPWVDSLGLHYHINDDGDRLQFELDVFNNHFVIVDDDFPNRLGFVPKKKDVSRTIGVELNGQVILQQVLGQRVRDKLKFFGLNLDTQSRNQHLARLAKVLGLATVDIENASNTLSIETVRKLLPRDWFCVLDTFRQKTGHNKTHGLSKTYDMFSSMGNGFTFELESLIFYAIALCVSRRHNKNKLDRRSVAVFGDDIILPASCYSDLKSVLRLYGFSVNEEKSFSQGLFYESCGFDFYDSSPVRPFFLKRHIQTVRDAYFVCNSMLFKMTKLKNIFLLPAYLVLYKAINHNNRCYGPLHLETASNNRWDDSNDDLEACLRVPLEYAQSKGAVKFDFTTFTYKYNTHRFISPIVPLSLNSQYAVRNILYLMLLKNGRTNKVTLRGFSKPLKAKATTSCWDGLLNLQERAVVSYIFSYIPHALNQE